MTKSQVAIALTNARKGSVMPVVDDRRETGRDMARAALAALARLRLRQRRGKRRSAGGLGL